ncbi:hypothetical protein [Nocardioides terrisoli]|uniref:hypothetical protein n=1 Tax=Nocardioides terrisoli TaxID=3388267 RepID=UPI00287B94C5|nr:hypothetical protein [Nocardioides marmorisolisilvae]
MGNVTLPAPLVVAGGVFCVLAGAVAGVALAPDHNDHNTATVVSYDSGSSRLCLSGSEAKAEKGANSSGELCGVWRHSGINHIPRPGQTFRFVAVYTSGSSAGQEHRQTVLYGDVVR